MILVDSSVWIDFFNGRRTSPTDRLADLLDTTPILMGDLILTEVLQGFRQERDYQKAKSLFEALPFAVMVGKDIALQSAAYFRFLRKKGVTIRKTIDGLIATFCLMNNLALLHDDRDFEPFRRFLALRTVSV